MSQVIATVGLTRRFENTHAVEDLSFDVRAGEVLALLGPNGAGKTTTMRLLNGILAPDEGSSRVCGLDPSRDGDAVRRLTGVLTEQAGLDERLTARENLLVTARIRKIDRATAASRADALLERFGMGPRADDLIRGFSTGQRKRVALARALLHEPEVLFLDEPTSGLDPEAIRDVLDLIAELAAEGRTIVLCTHFLAEADRLAQRMAVLISGRLRAFGSTAELAARHWSSLDVALEVGTDRGANAGLVARNTRGVVEVLDVTATTLRVRVEDREVIPTVIEALVRAGIAVFATVPHPPTLEDVYFAVLAEQAA
jgi:ABC-2 type transport system ATP-binding protein